MERKKHPELLNFERALAGFHFGSVLLDWDYEDDSQTLVRQSWMRHVRACSWLCFGRALDLDTPNSRSYGTMVTWTTAWLEMG